MKPVCRSIVLLALVCFSTIVASAEGGPIDLSKVDGTTLYLSGIPTATERAKQPRVWARMGTNLEIITNNDKVRVENPAFLNLLNTNPQFTQWLAKHGLKASDFEWLIVRNIDVTQGLIETKETSIIVRIPLAFDIRYYVKMPSGGNRNGTIEAFAHLKITIDKAGHVETVEVKAFDDSQLAESLARRAGFLAMFDRTFVESVSVPTLEAVFKDRSILKSAVEAAGLSGKLNAPLN